MNKSTQYILVGYPFSGKSTLAKALGERLGFAHINLDTMKGEFGFEDASDDDVPDEIWSKIFQEADKRLTAYLKEGKNVANETAWTTKKWRERARKVATEAGFSSKVIYLNVPLKLAKERWQKNRYEKQRYDTPDRVFEESINDFEIPTEDENVIILSHSENVDDWVKEVESES